MIDIISCGQEVVPLRYIRPAPAILLWHFTSGLLSTANSLQQPYAVFFHLRRKTWKGDSLERGHCNREYLNFNKINVLIQSAKQSRSKCHKRGWGGADSLEVTLSKNNCSIILLIPYISVTNHLRYSIRKLANYPTGSRQHNCLMGLDNFNFKSIFKYHSIPRAGAAIP